MAYNIHIKTADGGVQYPNASSYGVKDHILRVRQGKETIYFSPTYWWQYTVDPQSDDPLGLDLDEFDDEDYEDVEDE